jgi:iron(III) transport system ATP-binding protein
MVFQSYALWPHMTVRENVAFGLEQRKVSRDDIRRRVDEALSMVHMTDRADHRPNQLSGGQQQRVALARALVIHPKCLLLDEPLSNLDAKLRMEMRSEIRRICKSSGLTAIYVTHDQKEALSVADELAILDKGKIEQSGAPRDVYLRPVNRFVANFIGETNFIEGELAAGGGDGRRTIRTACGDIASSALPPDLPASGRVVLSIRPETIRLGPAPADTPNAFRGWLHDTVYLGETAQHQLQAAAASDVGAEGPSLKVFELNPRTVARDNAREDIRFWVAPEDVVVLKP